MPTKKARERREERKRSKLISLKRGRLSAAEKQHIASHAVSQNSEQIAKLLGRPVEQVQNELDRITGMKSEKRLSLEKQLETRPEWRQFRKQFTDEELDDFKHQYVQIMSQLKDQEVFATEELQIFQVITLKILIDRALAEQKFALDDMNQAHAIIEQFNSEPAKNEKDRALVMQAVERYEVAKRTNKECADRYKIYSDKQDKMLTALKATRDQRVKVWENSKTSILGWLRAAMEEGPRRLMGDEAEMMKIVSQKEKERLSKPHTFQDGTIDQPVFTPETAQLEFD